MDQGQQTLETHSAGLPIYQAAPPRRDPSKPSRVIMIYPEQGVSGTYVRHMPLSLLYASVELVQDGFDVKILDTRLHPNDWHKKLKTLLGNDVLAVGISVMSGYRKSSHSAWTDMRGVGVKGDDFKLNFVKSPQKKGS